MISCLKFDFFLLKMRPKPRKSDGIGGPAQFSGSKLPMYQEIARYWKHIRLTIEAEQIKNKAVAKKSDFSSKFAILRIYMICCNINKNITSPVLVSYMKLMNHILLYIIIRSKDAFNSWQATPLARWTQLSEMDFVKQLC